MLIGTTNPHKIREIGGICAPLDIPLEPLSLDIEELGDTFEANALSKAVGYARARPGQTVLVDDSGLVVPALEGLPGAWSARFDDLDLATRTVRPSGRGRAEMDVANCTRLLEQMRAIPPERRGAYFIACIIVARDERVHFQVTRKAAGWILAEARGDGGFGYDPVFASDTSFGRSWAEIDAARKNLISHRGEALWDLQAWLCSDAAGEVL